MLPLYKISNKCFKANKVVCGTATLMEAALNKSKYNLFGSRYLTNLLLIISSNQPYLSCRTNDTRLSVAALERCVTAISHWMSANRLKLNMEKTEWLWMGIKSIKP